MNFRKILKPGILVVLVMFIATMLTACGNSPKSVVKDYLNAQKNGNAKKIVNLIYPEVLEERLEQQDMTKKELIEEMQEEYDELDKDDKKEAKKTKFKIVEVDDVKEKDFEAMKEAWDEKYDKPLKDAKEVEVEVKDADGDEYERKITVIKVGSKWYIA